MREDKKMTYRERRAIWDVCRVCNKLKLCDKGCFESYLAKRGKTYEERWPQDKNAPRGRVCIDCRIEANRKFCLERGLKMYKATTISHWFTKAGRDPRFSNKMVNARKPLWHQLPKELHPAANRKLEERLNRFNEKHGYPANSHQKYLLVAGVIKDIKYPDYRMFTNHRVEIKRHRRYIFRLLRARENASKIPHVAEGHRTAQTTMVGI